MAKKYLSGYTTSVTVKINECELECTGFYEVGEAEDFDTQPTGATFDIEKMELVKGDLIDFTLSNPNMVDIETRCIDIIENL
jgi:hypothetical protein